MLRFEPARLLRLHLCERDRCEGRPLYEAIVEKCRELGIAGATVFRGLEGYGETAEIHRSHALSHELPIVITVADSAEAIERLIAAVEPMLATGVMAVSAVEMARVRK
jgi:PII-like signaling protein